MKESELVSIMEEQGWTCKKDEVGDCFCIIVVDNIQIQVIPFIGKRADHFRVSLAPSISSREFSEAVGFIYGEGRDYSPIIFSNEPPKKLASLSAEDVLQLADEAISWALSQSLEDGLTAYRGLPTAAKGAMPLRHLAALAITGDVERLEGYKQSFAEGDRLGFVPYITVDMVDRAILIARKHSK
ncbi:DUF6990 domain-containing protein [Ectopseudomonas khazarica]|uniref:DUF6990 domain-containing protein n=2 Tax=Pseudomonadaceae TaxID=135621 RepID=UPI0037CC801D